MSSPSRLTTLGRHIHLVRVVAVSQGLRLLNHSRLKPRWILGPPLSLDPALLVRRALPCRDLVEGAPLGFDPDLRVVRKHGGRAMPGDAYDQLVADAMRPFSLRAWRLVNRLCLGGRL